MNLISNTFIYWSSRQEIYRRAALFWTFLIVDFIIQSKSQGSEAVIINGFGFTMIPLALLSYASLAFTKTQYPRRTLVLIPLAIVSTQFLLETSLSFTIKAMPYATVAALPLFYVAYTYLLKERKNITPLMAFHAVVLILLAIHSFNFAFFRMEPEAQLWGWPVAYAIYQLLAGLLPAMTIDFYHRKEEDRLNQIIDSKTSHLKEANKKLSQAVEQKNYLFRTLTHDISTPLSIARMKIDLFIRNPLDQKKFCNDVSSVVQRMEEMVNQVQTLAAFESDNIELETEDVSLIECVQSVHAFFHEVLTAKEIDLAYSKADLRDIWVSVDRQSFTNSVLPNILSNAIKFSDQGGKIEIMTELVDQEFISLKIKDYGIGMPEWLRNSLFDFEAKTHRPGTHNEGGTGFGIPIIGRIMHFYGGDIQVTSQERGPDGHGGFTQFELRLKYRKMDTVQAA